MSDEGPHYPPDPETDVPPDPEVGFPAGAEETSRQAVTESPADEDSGAEEPADDFTNPYAADPESAQAYGDGYREGAFGHHGHEPPPSLSWELAKIWSEGNEAGLGRFAVYRMGYREGIEAGLRGEPATKDHSGDAAIAWANGLAAGAERAADIRAAIDRKATGSFFFEVATGRIHEFYAIDRRWYSQEFDDGRRCIFLAWPDEAFAIDEPIYAKYRDLHGPEGDLGIPLQDSGPVGNGVVGRFHGGNIYWTERTGAHEVRGKIKDVWLSRGEPDDPRGLGYPTSDRYADPSGGWAADVRAL